MSCRRGIMVNMIRLRRAYVRATRRTRTYGGMLCKECRSAIHTCLCVSTDKNSASPRALQLSAIEQCMKKILTRIALPTTPSRAGCYANSLTHPQLACARTFKCERVSCSYAWAMQIFFTRVRRRVALASSTMRRVRRQRGPRTHTHSINVLWKSRLNWLNNVWCSRERARARTRHVCVRGTPRTRGRRTSSSSSASNARGARLFAQYFVRIESAHTCARTLEHYTHAHACVYEF